MKIDTDGYSFSVAFCLTAIILVAVYRVTGNVYFLTAAVLAGVATLYTLYFFRDPERVSEAKTGAVISAADGVIVDVSRLDGAKGGEAFDLRIAVFMNIFNVHINRTPLDGTVIATSHQPGKKLSVLNPRAEYDNEYGDTDIRTKHGIVRIRQIAGLIARRVVTRVREGDDLTRGERIGLIRFGSRVDVFLPAGYKPTVNNGDKVKAGVTVIAVIDDA